MSSSNCCFLTCIQVSQEAGKVVCYSHLFKNFPQFVEIHTVKGFSILNESEVDAFLEFSCFFCDPTDIDNLISGFSKSSLYIWKSSVHVLVKPSLEDFEHYFASMWNECDCAVVWTWVNELWEIVRDRDSGVLQSMKSQRVGHIWAPEQRWYQETWEIKKQEGDRKDIWNRVSCHWLAPHAVSL